MKRLFQIYLVALLSLLCIQLAPAQADIRQVDFKNFTYQPFCAGGEDGDGTYTLTVKNGKFENVKLEDGVYVTKDENFPNYFEIEQIIFGDLDGDKKDEAVVRTNCNTGGTGQFSEGFVYTIKDNKAILSTRLAGGDRGYGGLQNARIENKFLIVDRNDAGRHGGNCCAEFVETTKYRWDGEKLVQSGKITWREIIPSDRISFRRGASNTVMAVRLPKSERKRFIIRASQGQNLIVTTDAKQANSVFCLLLKGDAEVDENSTDSINAKLNKNGDYVFELRNEGSKNLNLSVNIEIR